MIRRRLVSIYASALMLAATQTGAMECEFDDIAILGTNSVYLQRDTSVTGDVVVNDASPGPVLSAGVELDVDRGAAVTGNLSADSIDLSGNTTINGDVSYNELIDRGAGGMFAEITPLALPVFDSLPAFQQAVVRPEPPPPHDPGLGEDVFVAANTTVTLTAGEYGDITIEGGGSGGGTLVFSGGGVFNVRSIGFSTGAGGQCAFPCRSVEFDAPTDLRVVDRIDTERNGYVGTTGSAGVGASQILIYVGGVNGSTGTLAETPKAAQIGRESTVLANVYAPNGTVLVEQGSTIVGALIARDVDINKNTDVTGDSGFVNEPPVADPQTVFTNGDQNLNILLTANDPEGADLAFSIAGGGPVNGTILSVTPIMPDPVTAIDRETGEEITIQPPITSAIAVYDPAGGENEVDEFTFVVTDDCGNTGMATVQINPLDPSPPTPGLDAVEASDQELDVIVGATVQITLDAGGPEDVTLAYSILSLPGTGSLTDSGSNAIESVPYALPDATVFYTAGASPGSDQFSFAARDDETAAPPPCAAPDCASATVLIGINFQTELAEDQTVETDVNIPVLFTLSGNPGGGSGTPQQKSLKALPGADIAGNVSDANGDGFGDGRDNLPGPAPVLVAAGVDFNLGPASSGSTTDPDNDALPSGSSSPDPDPDVISATVSTDGTDLTLQVRYKAGTFDSQLTRAQFLLDTDQNPATGNPGTTSGCPTPPDTGIIGSEFLVNMGGDVNGTNAVVRNYLGTCNSFGFSGNGTVTYLADGMDATVPLSLIGGDDGKLNYKVTISEQINPGSGGSTGVLDTMPDTGLPAVDSNPGVEGVARVQIEWDIGTLDGLAGEAIESAQVTLSTEKGTVDDLDTMFFAGTEDQDGNLAASDFETDTTPIPGVVMPVPDVPTGTEGTFTFDVTNEVRTAVAAGFNYFTVQGQVDEQLAGLGFRRGLQINSTATGNLTAGTEPKLDVVVSPDTGLPLIWKITALPSSGTVKTLAGATVGLNQVFTESPPTLVYTPIQGGTFNLTYEVTEATVVDTALVQFIVGLNDPCLIVGRPPGCTPE